MSKYGVISGPYFPIFGLNTSIQSTERNTEYLSVFSPNTGKYGQEITQYLDTFHAVWIVQVSQCITKSQMGSYIVLVFLGF